MYYLLYDEIIRNIIKLKNEKPKLNILWISILKNVYVLLVNIFIIL